MTETNLVLLDRMTDDELRNRVRVALLRAATAEMKDGAGTHKPYAWKVLQPGNFSREEAQTLLNYLIIDNEDAPIPDTDGGINTAVGGLFDSMAVIYEASIAPPAGP